MTQEFMIDGSLPPSHAAWLMMNGEVEGTDPDFTIMFDGGDIDTMRVGMKELTEMGCTFYRWTKTNGQSGIVDGWKVRPAKQGRVGYGQRIKEF